MSDQTTRELAREVAMAVGWRIVHPDWMGEGHYELYTPDGRMMYDNGFGVLTDEGVDSAIPDYPHDLNACARDLVREGYKFHLEQLDSGLWCGYYTEDGELFAKLIGWNKDANSAVAWCEAFLALQRYKAAQANALEPGEG